MGGGQEGKGDWRGLIGESRGECMYEMKRGKYECCMSRRGYIS